MPSRRRTLQILSGAALSGILAVRPTLATTAHQYRWILLYWMPYDNDLSRYVSEIVAQLTAGVGSDQLLVLVQADTVDQPNMVRYVISAQGVDVQTLAEGNSADPRAFEDFLGWAASYPAAQRMLAVVGHGGRLTQLSPDYGEGDAPQWLDIRDVRDAIATFNQRTDKTLDLFFFQNCNKATLAACQTMAAVAQYTLASQDLLGAPNRYYQPLLRWLARTGQVTGYTLAHRIRAYETADMYLGYTVVDNQRLRAGLADSLNPLINRLWHRSWAAIDLSELERLRYFGDTYIDLVAFLTLLTRQVGGAEVELNQFVQFLQQAIDYLPNPTPTAFADFSRVEVLQNWAAIEALYLEQLSGLSLYLPASVAAFQDRAYTELYRGVSLPALLQRLLQGGYLSVYGSAE